MTPNTLSEYKQNISRKSEKLCKKLWRALQHWYFLHITQMWLAVIANM